MDALRIAICDDDTMALETYTKLCHVISEKHNIDAEIKSYGSGNDLMFDLEDPMFYNTLDLLLLDISMPGIGGIEVAKKAREFGYSGIVIFITASEDHFREAFDLGAFHYITKGESLKRFEEIFLKAVALSNDENRKEIVLSGWGELRRLRISSIEYFEVINRVITVFYDNNEFKFQASFQKIEEQMRDYGFQRIHREYLISIPHIKSISFKNVIMQSEKVLPVGRKYYNDLKEAVNKIKL